VLPGKSRGRRLGLETDQDRVAASPHAELGQQTRHMELHRTLRDVKLRLSAAFTGGRRRAVWMIVKSRYGLRYGNDLACTDYQ